MMKQVIEAYWANNFQSLMSEAGWPAESPLSLDGTWNKMHCLAIRFRTTVNGMMSSVTFYLTYADFIEHAFDGTGPRVRVRALLLDNLRRLAKTICPT